VAPAFRRTQPAACLVGPRAAEEPIEDPGQLGRHDPDPGVGDHDPGRAVRGRGHADADRPAGLRELDRVADEVRDDLPDPLRIVAQADRRRRELEAQRDAPSTGRRSCLLDCRFDRGPEIVRTQVEEDEPRIELGELEQVLGQPVEPLELDPAVVQEFRARRRIVAGALGQELVEREEGRDRGPQLVRHVGQEIAAPIAVPANHRDARLELVGHRIELDRERGQLR